MDISESIIQRLELSPHDEGGYFKRIYTSPHPYPQPSPHTSQQKLVSSIYYLLTQKRPIGHMHRCKSDILHYFLEGDPITYHVLSESKGLILHTLSADQRFLVVPGSYWKASQLQGKHYALIAEVVIPEFCYEDRELGSAEKLRRYFPECFDKIKHLIIS